MTEPYLFQELFKLLIQLFFTQSMSHISRWHHETN